MSNQYLTEELHAAYATLNQFVVSANEPSDEAQITILKNEADLPESFPTMTTKSRS